MAEAVPWSFHGPTGPEKWKDLCAAYRDCGGKAQSPVDIRIEKVVTDESLPVLIPAYGTCRLNAERKEPMTRFPVAAGDPVLNVGAKQFRLVEIHFHSLSEHTVDGDRFPVEIHLVHESIGGDYLVVAVMLTEGSFHPSLQSCLNVWPANEGSFEGIEVFSPGSLLPQGLSYFHYSGSLTMPPCTENVSWYVLQDHTEAAPAQIHRLKTLLNNNYRPVQPLNGRKVKYSGKCC